eukprot:TRINITY_DN1808_c0_g2_i3.p1 TRINITY_DN1808_c0_g2~~TRINITY_DN1808_c0_g2_i3.p1  ORF type:complete len:510 (-),score=111.31 TRINITY_DN1808_c0_g2_i3:50-1579(-)
MSSTLSSSKKTFWRPNTIRPGSEVEREDAKEDTFVVWNPRQNLSLRQQRLSLPIYQKRRQFLYAIEKYRTVIVVGHTGSGKTTQIPQYLHEAGWTTANRAIACTQPRRVAASTIAARVAEEMNCRLGEEVGYSVRFDDCSDPSRTKIKYLTDGMLLRETMHDPLLSQYAVVMLDEAHERSLNTDILIGLLKKIQKKRKDLRLVVSSATLDACLFKAFFEENKTTDEKKDTAVILSVEGRQYPVDVLYSKYPVRDYLQATVDTISHIHKSMPSGDILAFLTGKEEIDRVVSKVSELSDRIVALPLYSGLPPEQQLQVFEPTSSSSIRKVIIATNVAEASITLEGIVYVIDAGFSKLKSYDPRTGMGQLIVTPVSQASANQRAGRAGRVRAGKCYRLYTEEAYYSLRPQTVPEMQRENLATVLLQLKALGIDDVLHFNFISPPPTPLMAHALEILYAAGALDKQCKLTKPLGTSLAEFPVEPLLAKMLYASGDMKCSEEMITIAAMYAPRI